MPARIIPREIAQSPRYRQSGGFVKRNGERFRRRCRDMRANMAFFSLVHARGRDRRARYCIDLLSSSISVFGSTKTTSGRSRVTASNSCLCWVGVQSTVRKIAKWG